MTWEHDMAVVKVKDVESRYWSAANDVVAADGFFERRWAVRELRKIRAELTEARAVRDRFAEMARIARDEIRQANLVDHLAAKAAPIDVPTQPLRRKK